MKWINKYLTIILLFGIFSISCVLFVQKTKNENLESRINTLNCNFSRLIEKDSTLIKEIQFQQFKEDNFITQLDRNTNLILWFIAIVFGLFGIISFASFNKRVSDLEKEQQEKYDDYINKSETLKDEILEIKSDLRGEIASIKEMEADKYFDSKKFDSFALFMLISIKYYSQYYEYQKDTNIELAESILEYVNSSIEDFRNKLSELDDKPKVNKETFKSISTAINNLDNFEINKLFAEVQLLLQYTEE